MDYLQLLVELCTMPVPITGHQLALVLHLSHYLTGLATLLARGVNAHKLALAGKVGLMPPCNLFSLDNPQGCLNAICMSWNTMVFSQTEL